MSALGKYLGTFIVFIWFAFAVITALTLIFLLWPFIGKGSSADRDRAFDARVYKDQLAEIEADTERGLISSEEAESARLEVSRRLLATSSQFENEKSPINSDAKRSDLNRGQRTSTEIVVLVISIAFIPVVTLGLYLTFGAPLEPGQPHAQRIKSPTEGQSLDVLISRVEQRLERNPDELRGWTLIAPIYMRLQRFPDAEKAYRQIIRLSGESPENLLRLGEAVVFGQNGKVSSEARKIFEKVVAANPSDRQALFWLALEKEQQGRFAEAVSAWQALLATGASDAPWRPLVEKHLKYSQEELASLKKSKHEDMVAEQATSDNSKGQALTRDLPGPTASDIENARNMTTNERSAMINQMVEGLAQRLETEGGELNEWQRLIRAYIVLGRKDAAQKAYIAARKAFQNDEGALKNLTIFVKSLGLKS